MKRQNRSREKSRAQPSRRQGAAPPPPARAAQAQTQAFQAVLVGGIVLRLLVFVYIGYFNNDNHLSVIEYVSRVWLPPRAAQFDQAYHPPLYYFLSAPLFLLGSLPVVQGLSLLLSILTLCLIAALLRRLPRLDEKLLPWCLALPAFHPQFIMFSLFISNDTLAIFLGALVFYQSWRVQAAPSSGNCTLLGIFLGLGLLTKAVFLVFVLPLILLVWSVVRRSDFPFTKVLARVSVFAFIVTAVGCYKYVENFAVYGNPLLSNLDFAPWAAEQRPTWIGLRSLLDFDIFKLVRNPIASVATAHSYPLMLYGSFWYSFVPDSTFRGNLIPPFDRLGSIIYLLALCPTVLSLIGASRIVRSFAGLSFDRSAENERAANRIIYDGALLLTLLLNLFLVVSVGWRYDVWSVFQARLFFPSYFAILIAFSAGLEWSAQSRAHFALVRAFLFALFGVFLVYFLTEVYLTTRYPVSPLTLDHMPYKIDMNAR